MRILPQRFVDMQKVLHSEVRMVRFRPPLVNMAILAGMQTLPVADVLVDLRSPAKLQFASKHVRFPRNVDSSESAFDFG